MQKGRGKHASSLWGKEARVSGILLLPGADNWFVDKKGSGKSERLGQIRPTKNGQLVAYLTSISRLLQMRNQRSVYTDSLPLLRQDVLDRTTVGLFIHNHSLYARNGITATTDHLSL